MLDLDETLIHYEDEGTQGRFLVRPYTFPFLKEMSKYYEIIIFTAAMQDYADWIINLLNKDNSISFQLYR